MRLNSRKLAARMLKIEQAEKGYILFHLETLIRHLEIREAARRGMPRPALHDHDIKREGCKRCGYVICDGKCRDS